MRQITILLRLIKSIHELGAVMRQSAGFSKLFIFDVRLLGAFGLVVIVLVWLWKHEPVKLRAPSRIARGKVGLHINSLAIAPKGEHMATITMDGQLALRTPNSGDQTERFLDFPGYARGVAFSPDGRSLAAAGWAPGICIWDLRSSISQPTKVIPVPIREVHCMMFSPDGRYLAVTSYLDERISIWDIMHDEMYVILHHVSPVVSLAFSPDGRWLATGGRKRSLILWDLPKGSRRVLLENGTGPTRGLAFSPDGTLLASASDFERLVRLWDVNTLTESRVFAGHTHAVISVAFSPDGSHLATAANDRTVGLWTVATGQRQARLDSQADILQTVAFSPDGRSLVLAVGDDDDLRFWDLADLH